MVRWYLFYLSGYVQSSYGLHVYNLLLHTANIPGGKFSEVSMLQIMLQQKLNYDETVNLCYINDVKSVWIYWFIKDFSDS